MVTNQKFNRDRSMDLYENPIELAEKAVALNMTVEEYATKMFQAKRDAETWNTVGNRFGTIVRVNTSPTSNSASIMASVVYTNNSGEEKIIKLGVLGPKGSDHPVNQLATIANSLIGQKVKFITVYQHDEQAGDFLYAKRVEKI